MCVVQLEVKSESVFGGTEPGKQMRCCECEIFISVILPLKMVRKIGSLTNRTCKKLCKNHEDEILQDIRQKRWLFVSIHS